MNQLKTYLQNVQARLENATEGPWKSLEYNASCDIQDSNGNVLIHIPYDDDLFPIKEDEANGQLIANCPTDLSTLLQIVRLQAEALEFYSKTHENDGAYVGQICFDRVQGNDCEVIGAFSIAGRKARQAIQQVETLVSGGKNDCV